MVDPDRERIRAKLAAVLAEAGMSLTELQRLDEEYDLTPNQQGLLMKAEALAWLLEADTPAELGARWELPHLRTDAGYPNCSTCEGGGCYDCTDPA